jgi:hypothetical protein
MQYTELAEQASKYGLGEAKEERPIRTDPLGQSSRILKKVFGAVAP